MLKSRWVQTVGEDNALFFEEIERAYSEPHRFYHTLGHLELCFSTLDEVFPTLRNRAVELALWFHDIVCDPKSATNEADSASLAKEFMVSARFPEWSLVEELVMATAHRAEPTTREARVVIDCDLAIFAEPKPIFDAYEANVRKEFSWVPEDRFVETRRAILSRFSERNFLFNTIEMRLRSEIDARVNLNRSLCRLAAYQPQKKEVAIPPEFETLLQELKESFERAKAVLRRF